MPAAMPTRSDTAFERASVLGRPLLLLAAAFVLRLPALVRPYFFSSDEAAYSALAVRMLHGADPYVGAVDHKPVGVDLVYAGIYAIAGANHIVAVHLVLVAVVWATAVTIGRIGALAGGNRAGSLAAFFYVCASAVGMPRDVQPANTELLLNLPTVVAAWLVYRTLTRDRSNPSKDRAAVAVFLLAGVLTGIAALFKYQAALAGIAWATATVWPPRRTDDAVRRLAALAAGFVMVAAILCGYFYLRGEWDAFTFWGWRYNFTYIAAMSTREKGASLLLRTGIICLFWLPLLLFAVAGRRPGRVPLLVVLWLVVECAAVSIGGRFFLYYYLVVLPPLSLAAALGADALVDRRRKTAAGIAVLGAVAIVVSTVLAWTWQRIRPEFLREHDVEVAVGTYIGTHSSPGDRLFVWGNASEIYYFANRVMGTRFAFCNYHAGKIWGSWSYAVDAGDTSMFVVPRAWTELLEDLDRAPPAFIVDSAAGGIANFDRHPIGRYEELARRVARNYRLETVVDGVPIYRRQAH
jgi:hypothetical protein